MGGSFYGDARAVLEISWHRRDDLLAGLEPGDDFHSIAVRSTNFDGTSLRDVPAQDEHGALSVVRPHSRFGDHHDPGSCRRVLTGCRRRLLVLTQKRHLDTHVWQNARV